MRTYAAELPACTEQCDGGICCWLGRDGEAGHGEEYTALLLDGVPDGHRDASDPKLRKCWRIRLEATGFVVYKISGSVAVKKRK